MQSNTCTHWCANLCKSITSKPHMFTVNSWNFATDLRTANFFISRILENCCVFVHLFCLTNLFLLYVSMVTLVMTYTETTIEFLSWDFMVLAKDWCKTLVLKLMASFKEPWRELVKFKCSQCSQTFFHPRVTNMYKEYKNI